jgi:hypothetical protein
VPMQAIGERCRLLSSLHVLSALLWFVTVDYCGFRVIAMVKQHSHSCLLCTHAFVMSARAALADRPPSHLRLRRFR